MDLEIRQFPKKTSARLAPPRNVTGNTATTKVTVKRDPPLQVSCVRPKCQSQPVERLPSKSIVKGESGTQTLVHPVETNIVKSYEWNEWTLRRKAIQLANIRSRATHSTQTHHSHMRRDNGTQTWLPKDAACQSRRDGHSNVPKPHVFLDGLRGQRQSHVVKVDLTCPVED